MNKKHITGAVLILALLGGVSWAMGLFSGDAELAEAEKLRDDLLQKVDTMTHEQRREEFGALREKTRDFSAEQRRSLGEGMRKFFMQKVDRMLVMPPQEQRAELDKWIDWMEGMRKNREAKGDEGKDRGGDRGGDMSSAQRDQRRKERLDRTTPEMRAKMDRVKDLINERRKQRGMEPIDRPGLGGPRGGR